jgi:hypothetical protein
MRPPPAPARTSSLLPLAALAICFTVWPGHVGSAGAADAPAEPAFVPPAKGKFKVFLLVGQSNMAGRGKVEPEDQKPHPRVWSLDKRGRWVPAVDPLHFDKPNVAGVGLGTTFGRTVADAYPGDVIGLVPCAVGGTSIDQWSSAAAKGLYADAVRRAKVALKDGTLAGILWHQGEADAKRAEDYPAKAAKLFADLRRDLDAEGVPVVLGTVGEFYASHEAINDAIRAAAKAVPNAACVEVTGLTHKGDKVHFDAASYREMGRRYAAAWAALAKAARPHTANP